MANAFASQGDMSEKKITFNEIGDGLYAFTAEGDPNSGVIIGTDAFAHLPSKIRPVIGSDAPKNVAVRMVVQEPVSN